MTNIDVRLRPEWVENVGYRYDVLLDDEVIVRRSRDPEYDAARVLHARGIRGRFRTIDFRTGKPRMILDIEKAAKLRTVERSDTGLIVVPYRPMSEEDKARARLHRAHQGRRSTEVVAPGMPVHPSNALAARAVQRAAGFNPERKPAATLHRRSPSWRPPDHGPARAQA